MNRCIKDSMISTQKILVTNEDKIIGINLGYDFIKEHENGIPEIRNFFNINNFDFGLSAYSIKKINLEKHILYNKIKIKNINYIYLIFSTKILNDISINDIIKLELFPFEDIFEIDEELYPGLYTAWDNHSFGILADEKYQSYLDDLYEAFLVGNISLDIHCDNFFSTEGLTICINSRIPNKIKDEIYKRDLYFMKLLYQMQIMENKKRVRN